MAILNIELISPLHIGSDLTWQKDIHYLHDNNMVYFIKPETLAAKPSDLFETTSLPRLAAKLDLDNKAILEKSFRGLPFFSLDDKSPNNIAAFQRSAGRLFIAGSAIKGALRTAWLADLLKLKLMNTLADSTVKDIERLKKELRWKPQADPFRAVQVSDGLDYLPAKDCAALHVNIISNKFGEYEPKMRQYVEAVCPRPESPIRLKIRLRLIADELLKGGNRQELKFIRKYADSLGVGNLTKAANTHALQALEQDGWFFKSIADDNYPNVNQKRGLLRWLESLQQEAAAYLENPNGTFLLNIGWGGGIALKSLLPYLKNTPEAGREHWLKVRLLHKVHRNCGTALSKYGKCPSCDMKPADEDIVAVDAVSRKLVWQAPGYEHPVRLGWLRVKLGEVR